MVSSRTSNRSPVASPSADFLDQLAVEAMPVALVMLLIGGFVLAAEGERLFGLRDGFHPGLLLFLWSLLMWRVRSLSRLAAAWGLVLGLTAAVLFIVASEQASGALALLALATGAATLFISPLAGALTATAVTVFLVQGPGPFHLLSLGARVLTGIQVWGVVGLVWSAVRGLSSAIEWSWFSYERSLQLLEQARDRELQHRQTVADLADANLQLTRLNALARGLSEAADEARRAKEQFVANVSHELRTPLNMIIGFSEMILRASDSYGVQLPSALLADLTVILRNSQHLSGLIDDVLDLSQIEAGQMALTKEWVRFAEIAEAAAVAVRPLFDSKRLALQVNVPDDVMIYCDRTRMREVLLNLLSNAGRFTEQGGAVVAAARSGLDILISVADTGSGIAPQDKARLFQPFQQVDGSIRRRFGGSGLGLSLAQSFIEQHQGMIDVDSRPGRTCFTILLPISDRA